ncbi:MAG: alpha-hydroxy-acid oxidizing protein [Rhodospirillales bacterium]|nr:alpha-hydroxy-acid oxidizing protein [Rhodospirillales bacterium]
MTYKKARNIADLRVLSKKRLPTPMFHFIDGGADDEVSLRRNISAFDDYILTPDYLTDVANIDTKTSFLGGQSALPLMLSPTGTSRLFHHEKELAVVRAAAKFDIPYALSAMSTSSIEEVGRASNSHKIFQVYIMRDRSLTADWVARSRAAGFKTICLTVDTPMAGNRERDLINGMTIPPRFSPATLLGFALHPHWLANFALHPRFELSNIIHKSDVLGAQGNTSVIDYVNSQFDRSITWEDAAWLAEQWDGPFIIKGLMSAGDARKARDVGATAIMISNHGGRQLDGAPAPIDCVKSIRDAIGDDLELIVDGGVRRGSHMVKALAAGANACAIGRAYLYGLSAGGQAGVEKCLSIFKSELERTMTLLGARTIAEIRPDHLARNGTADGSSDN